MKVLHETTLAMIDRHATDLLDTSRAAVDAAHPRSVDDVRGHSAPLRFSVPMFMQHRELKRFLRRRLYRHYRVQRMSWRG